MLALIMLCCHAKAPPAGAPPAQVERCQGTCTPTLAQNGPRLVQPFRSAATPAPVGNSSVVSKKIVREVGTVTCTTDYGQIRTGRCHGRDLSTSTILIIVPQRRPSLKPPRRPCSPDLPPALRLGDPVEQRSCHCSQRCRHFQPLCVSKKVAKTAPWKPPLLRAMCAAKWGEQQSGRLSSQACIACSMDRTGWHCW